MMNKYKGHMDFIFLFTKNLTLLLAFVGCIYTFDHPSSGMKCSDGIVTDREGIIVSPRYPEQYPNHISCTWHIVGNTGELITILFHDLDIEESGFCRDPPCCVFNWVKLGPSFNGSEKQYCGQNGLYRPTFVSSFNKVWIKFHISSVVNAGRGFKLFYTINPKRIRSCKDDDFRCTDSNKCVPKLARCNGENECSDQSDEKFCSDFCPSGKSCDSMFLCYDKEKRCNGIVDCPDYSDEVACGQCAMNESRCGSDSSQCYNPNTQRCNRIMDCLNGVDEKDCVHRCPGKIMCASGNGCYTIVERCNGVAQCSDSSDEKNCGSDLCNYERGGFLCGNGRCIRDIWKCDRTNDCGDGTDEYNCLRNSVLTAAVMGSLICALLLVIAISCTCRLYALRSLEHQMENHETVLTRMSQEFLFREPPPSYAVAVGDHQRSLCVENVHYNTNIRRGRRRPRRARRQLDSQRPSLSPPLDNSRTQNCIINGPQMNFTFPCVPPLPHLSSRPQMNPFTLHSPSDLSTSSSTTATTGVSIVSSGSGSEGENVNALTMNVENSDGQEHCKQKPKDEQTKISSDLAKEPNDSDQNAESSFSISRAQKTDYVENLQVLQLLQNDPSLVFVDDQQNPGHNSSNTPFQKEQNSSNNDRKNSSSLGDEGCDSDSLPLIP